MHLTRSRVYGDSVRPVALAPQFTFGASGTVQIVDVANYFYGIRLYGDSKDK